MNLHHLPTTTPAALPVRLSDGSQARVLDINPSSIYIETDSQQQICGPLNFEMQMPGSRLKFVAQGEVVRVDIRGPKRGFVVRLSQLRLRPID
jgi:hypothetical protein